MKKEKELFFKMPFLYDEDLTVMVSELFEQWKKEKKDLEE